MPYFKRKREISIPIHILAITVWLDIKFGKTYLPELLCIGQVLIYLYWRISWRLTLGTKANGSKKDFM